MLMPREMIRGNTMGSQRGQRYMEMGDGHKDPELVEHPHDARHDQTALYRAGLNPSGFNPAGARCQFVTSDQFGQSQEPVARRTGECGSGQGAATRSGVRSDHQKISCPNICGRTKDSIAYRHSLQKQLAHSPTLAGKGPRRRPFTISLGCV
jgi:hypothetical protein